MTVDPVERARAIRDSQILLDMTDVADRPADVKAEQDKADGLSRELAPDGTSYAVWATGTLRCWECGILVERQWERCQQCGVEL